MTNDRGCSIQRLFLQHCHLSDKCAQIIISGLYVSNESKFKSTLIELNLSNNDIGYIEVDALADIHGKHGGVDKTFCETLGEMLISKNCSLESLYMGW